MSIRYPLLMVGFYLLTLFPLNVNAVEVLRVASMAVNGDIREAFSTLAHTFEQENPNVKIQFVMKSDANLKQDLEQMLVNQEVDVVTWHSGERLNYFIEQNLVESITALWNKNNLDQRFSSLLKQGVSVSGGIYAMPISYYQWGIYYKKSLFERLNIEPPADWSSLHQALAVLKKQDMTPIFIGTKNPWPVGAWFEYINLRLNGLDFHHQFVAGEVSANDDRIKAVLMTWKVLLDMGYFYREHKNKDLADSFGVIYREQAAMVLSGHLAESFLPLDIRGDIGYFPFPKIKDGVENVFVTPMDIMFIAKSASNLSLANKFLLFMSDKEVQQELNRKFGQFPANKNSKILAAPLLKKAKLEVDRADGLTHFFDREVEKQYGVDCLKIWKGFLEHHNVSKTQQMMEHARNEYLTRKAKH